MTAWPHSIAAVLWIGWLVYWGIAAARTKPTARQESVASRLIYTVPLWFAGWLMIDGRLRIAVLHVRFVPDGWAIEIAGLIVVIAGITFAVWARVHLGANWSGTVTIKQDHALIQSGPYGLVRHPIYTGLIAAIAGTALVFGEWRDLVAFVLVVASCWYKLGVEERLMAETFGPAYEDYRGRVPALIPFLL